MNTEPAAFHRETWALRAPLGFGAWMVLLMFGLKILALPLILVLGGGDTSGPVLQGGMGLVLLSFALLPLETVVGQALPIWTLKKFGVQRWLTLCALSAAFFGLLHLAAGPGGFVIGFTSGVVLSYCWLSWRKRSFLTAFWSTTAVHAAHNAVAFSLYLIGEMLT